MITNSTPAIPICKLEQHLTSICQDNVTSQDQLTAASSQLRQSFQFLGLAILIFPILLALAGLSLVLEWPGLTISFVIGSGLLPAILLSAAKISFQRFHHNNIYTQIQHPSLSPEQFQLTHSHDELPETSKILSEPEVTSTNNITWSSATSTVYLQDQVFSAIKAALRAYSEKKWDLFSEYTRAFLVSGLRLGIFKLTGQIPNTHLNQILATLPIEDVSETLEAWLHRLTSARQDVPLNQIEAQRVMSFIVHILQQLNVILPKWENRIHRIIPRVQTLTPPLKPQVLSIRQTYQTPPSLSHKKEATFIPQPQPKSETKNVHLQVKSQQELDSLSNLIQHGASPFLFVFANRFHTDWSTLDKVLNDASTALSTQINIVVFPTLGDTNLDPKIKDFFQFFRIEGETSSPTLPFICVITRSQLLHVIEEEMPIPPNLIIDARSEGFVERVREMAKIAQDYELVSLDVKEPEQHKEPQDLRNLETITEKAINPTTVKIQSSSQLLANTDDVIDEVIAVQPLSNVRRIMEVDLEAAQQRRELASMVPIALAVVQMPEDQSLLDEMEAAAQNEPHLIVQFVDAKVHPQASEVLNIPSGSVRLRFNGRERVLDQPKTDHLLANIRQLRALNTIPELTVDSTDRSPNPTEQTSTRREPTQQKG